MHHRDVGLFLLGLSAAATAVCIAVSCSDQPKVKCTAGRGRFAASYKSMSTPDAGPCALAGEAIGVQVYNPANADDTNIDPDRATLWVKGKSMTDTALERGGPDPDPSHQPNAIGSFSASEPGADSFCNVPQLSPAEQQWPATDAGLLATSIKYEWSNVRVVVAPNALGTQLVGELKYTKDGCTADYHVTALYPYVECGSSGTALDFCPCLPYADPAFGRAKGSGISPDLFGEPRFGADACEQGEPQAAALEQAARVTCDRVAHICVLKGEPPQ